MKPLVFHFPDDEGFARELTAKIDGEAATLEWRRFPDRESLITLRGECAGRDTIVVCTLTDPDAKTLPLYFTATTARELGARRIGLVAPYLGYMRQDRRFRPGEALSAHSYARFLSTSFDWLITVDPHLHRIHRLDEIFSISATAVSAMPAVSEWIAANVQNPVLIGPDRESAQWAARVAHSLDAPYVVLDKVRSGDRAVSVSALDAQVIRDHNPVIIDDIASSGHTLAETLQGFAPHRAAAVTCIVVHALFAEGAQEVLHNAGARRIVSTNTVAHVTNGIDVVPLIASALNGLLAP